MKLAETIKLYRVNLDKQFTIMQNLQGSREISIAITSAQNAKMWLGMALHKLGAENPYPDSKNAANTKIEPTADTWNGDVCKELAGIGHTQKVKQLRFELTALADEIENLKSSEMFSHIIETMMFHSFIKSWEYVVESNMWLGMELGRIKKAEDERN